MTLYVITLMWNQQCDWCEETIYEGESAYYNPKTKQVYHKEPYECYELAEAG